MMLRMLAPVTAVALIGWMAAPGVAQAQTPKTHSPQSSPAKSSSAKSSKAKSHAKPAAKPAVPHVGGAEPTLLGQFGGFPRRVPANLQGPCGIECRFRCFDIEKKFLSFYAEVHRQDESRYEQLTLR